MQKSFLSLLCAGSLLLAGPVLAQTPSAFQSGSSISSSGVNTAMGTKADILNGTLTNPTVVGGASVNGPLIWLNPGSGPQNTTYATGGLTNGVIIAAGGNRISYCPPLSCVTSPSADHQRTSALFWSTTSDDGHSEEQTVAIQTIIGTGAYKTWAPSTDYAVGDNVNFPAANTVYRATRAGTSASSGAGPTGKGSGITDGSVVWQWINDSAINSKVGLYNEVKVIPGSGNTWAQANNVQLTSGVIPKFNLNTELDFTNVSGNDCTLGTVTCTNLMLINGGTNKTTSALTIAPNGILPGLSPNPAYYGVLIAGQIAANADIEDDGTGSQYGLAFGSFTPSSHTNSDIYINTSSPQGMLVNGTHSAQAISDTSTAPAAINLAGNYSLAAIFTGGATTPTALAIKDNQRICFNGTDACFVHSVAQGKLYYQVGNASLFSIADTTGNAIFKGSVTGNGSP